MQDFPDNEAMQEEQAAQTTPAPDRNRDVYRPITLLLLFGLVALTVYAFKYPLQRTYQSWGSEQGYNPNGHWIVLLSGMLVFMNRKNLQAIPKRICYAGLGFIVAALLWSLAFKRGDINAMQTIGFIGLVWAVCLYLGGWGLARAMMFPLFLSLFAVQWGLGSSTAALTMRLYSTDIACWTINFIGPPLGVAVLQEGTRVSMQSMPDLAFDVAAPCSGLQSLIMTIVLALLLCYMMLRTWWKHAVMVLLIVPVAIANNALRIMLIACTGALFGNIWGPKIGTEKMVAFHMVVGAVAYAIGFAVLWLMAMWLERMPGIERELWLQHKAAKEVEKARAHDAEPEPEATAAPGPPRDYSRYAYLWKHVLVVIGLVAAALVGGNYAKHVIYYSKGLPSTDNIPQMVMRMVDHPGAGRKVPLYQFEPLPYVTNFPWRVGTRVQVPIPVSEIELKQLPVDTEYFRAIYVLTNRHRIYFNAAKYTVASPESNEYETVANGLRGMLEGIDLTSNELLHAVYIARTSLPRLGPQATIGHLMGFMAQCDRQPDSVVVAVVQNKSDQHSIHTPEACYPSQGWQIGKPEPIPMTLGGEPVEVARMKGELRSQNIRECAIYWYQREGMHGRRMYATGDFFWLPFKTAFNLIFRGRSDRWAFVRVSMTVPEGGSYEATSERILAFIKEIEPSLIYGN